jgi:hypothetical protein
MEEAEANWSAEMSALTTNNTLLNNEIQKGIYDVFISEAKSIVRDLPLEEKVKEISFILNARHGLRLASKFGGLVSVELHTDTAHDIKAIEYWGKRLHEICPDQFIVKVPFTAEGLIGARRLREAGVRINFTLEFSARENVLVTRIHENYDVSIFDSAKDAHIEKFWTVSDKVLNLAGRLAAKVPATGAELIHIAHEEGCEDMFPVLTKDEKAFIASDGKIPVYSRWAEKIKEGKIAPDTLLTLAGLASFTADQKMLDERIRSIIG